MMSMNMIRNFDNEVRYMSRDVRNPGPAQTGLYSQETKRLDTCIISVVKTKVLISCAVIARLICAFVFADFFFMLCSSY